MLDNRLKLVLGKFISKTQHAFMEGRLRLDASLIVNEVIDSNRKSKERPVLCKFEIEKASNHVDWSFFCYRLWEKWALEIWESERLVIFLLFIWTYRWVPRLSR